MRPFFLEMPVCHRDSGQHDNGEKNERYQEAGVTGSHVFGARRRHLRSLVYARGDYETRTLWMASSFFIFFMASSPSVILPKTV